jgi:hypothetical protein
MHDFNWKDNDGTAACKVITAIRERDEETAIGAGADNDPKPG